MDVIPAIDLMEGHVVRLRLGDERQVKIYEHFGGPVQVARKWERAGAPAIHIIDLDAAMNRGNNRQLVKKIVKQTSLPIQFGGGLRTKQLVAEMLTSGVTRTILGTMAFNNPSALLQLLHEYGKERIIVALDYLDNRVMIKGWKTHTSYQLNEAIDRFIHLGVESILLTSISKDGLLVGPDHTLLQKVSDKDINIYAAGGVASLHDIEILKETGITGVIIGKALYENRFTLEEAIDIARR